MNYQDNEFNKCVLILSMLTLIIMYSEYMHIAILKYTLRT